MTYTTPTNGALFPSSPAAGVNQYRYDAVTETWNIIVPDQTVTPGSYGSSTTIPKFSVTESGAIFFAEDVEIQTSSTTQPGIVQLVDDTITNDNTKALTAAAGYALQQEINTKGTGSGTVTRVSTGSGIVGGPITTSGTVSLANSGVTSGSYTNTNLTVDSFGRITSATSGSLSSGITQVIAGTGLSGGGITPVITLNNTGVLSLTAGSGIAINSSTGNITISSTGGGSGTVTQVNTGTGLTGGPITTTGTIQLASSGVVAGSYTFASFTVDSRGRITTASSNTPVTQVNTGTGLSGGPITTTGTVSLANTAVTPGSYTNSNITVDAQGRLTSATSGTVSTGVTQIVAGTNVTVSPAGGTGIVTVNSTSGGGGTITAVVAGTGLSGGGSSGSVTLTNAGVTQLTAGTNITLSGSTGNVTITAAGGNVGTITGVTAGTGLSGGGTSGNVTLTNTGVTQLIAGASIAISGSTGSVTLSNTGVLSLIAGPNITLSGSTGNITISAAGGAGSGTVTSVTSGAGLQTTPLAGITGAGSVEIAPLGIVDSMVSNTAAIRSTKLHYKFPAANTITQTVQQRLEEIILVTDWGAVPDGVTNNVFAIQDALNYITSIGGGTLFFPPGVYASDRIGVYSNTKIEGSGATLKTFGNPDRQIYLIANSENITISNMNFDSPGLVPAPPLEAGVIWDLGSQKNFRLENCSFFNIPLNQGQRMTVIQMQAVSCIIKNNYVDQCGGDCLNFNGVGFNVVSGNFIQNGGDGGIAFNNGAKGCITGNTIRKCVLGVGSGPTGTTANPFSQYSVTGNTIDSCDLGMDLGFFQFAGREGPVNVSISGNSITRCKTTGIRYFGRPGGVDAKIAFTGNVISDMGTADFDGVPYGAADGFEIANCPESSITGNIVTNVTRSCINISGSPGMSVTSNTLKNGQNGVIFGNSSTRFIISLNQIKSMSISAVTTGAGSTNFINTSNLVTA